jgi:peptide deformylase
MAVLEIARMGQPVLRRRAQAVDLPLDSAMRQFLDDMAETMVAAHGTGLAAPQVFQPLRAIVFKVDAERQRRSVAQLDDLPDPATAGQGVALTYLLNPEVEPLDAAVDEGYEACLSIPGLTGRVPRWRHIRYRGTDPQGRPIERTASGFHARLVQHEVDHLDGILYPERMRDLATLAFVSEIAKSRTDADRQPRAGDAPERGDGAR